MSAQAEQQSGGMVTGWLGEWADMILGSKEGGWEFSAIEQQAIDMTMSNSRCCNVILADIFLSPDWHQWSMGYGGGLWRDTAGWHA